MCVRTEEVGVGVVSREGRPQPQMITTLRRALRALRAVTLRRVVFLCLLLQIQHQTITVLFALRMPRRKEAKGVTSSYTRLLLRDECRV